MVPISAQVGGFPPPQARASCIASHSCHACSPHHGGPAGATILCINIDPAWEWGAPVAYRGPTVLLTRACLTPQTPEMFVEGREPPWAPRRASTFTLGKITVLFFSSMKRSLMASGGERSLGIKTSQECEAHRCACHRLGRHAARRRTLLASRCGGLPVASMPGFWFREGQSGDQPPWVSTSCFLQRGVRERGTLRPAPRKGLLDRCQRAQKLLEPPSRVWPGAARHHTALDL